MRDGWIREEEGKGMKVDGCRYSIYTLQLQDVHSTSQSVSHSGLNKRLISKD